MDLLPHIHSTLDIAIYLVFALVASLAAALLIVGKLRLVAVVWHLILATTLAVGGALFASTLDAPRMVAVALGFVGASMGAALAYSVAPWRGAAATALAIVAWIAFVNTA